MAFKFYMNLTFWILCSIKTWLTGGADIKNWVVLGPVCQRFCARAPPAWPFAFVIIIVMRGFLFQYCRILKTQRRSLHKISKRCNQEVNFKEESRICCPVEMSQCIIWERFTILSGHNFHRVAPPAISHTF